MDDDEQRTAKKYPISISKLSKTPSWIMLGFVLGALFVIALPPIGRDKSAPPPAKPVEPPKPVSPAPSQVATIQAVFEDPRWEAIVAATWSNDINEVAFWNSGTREFSDFFEVRRVAGLNYFRSIPALTRPLMTNVRGLSDDCPLRFTARPLEEINYGAEPPAANERKPERGWKPPVQKPGVTLPSVTAPERVTPELPKFEISPKTTPPEK
jgi:hypothetical protein